MYPTQASATASASEPSSPAINNGSDQDHAAGPIYEEADPLSVNVEAAAVQSADEGANQSPSGVESKEEDDNGVSNALPETDKKEASVPEVAAVSVAVTKPVTKVRKEILLVKKREKPAPTPPTPRSGVV